MAKKQNRFEFESPEQRTKYVNEVIRYFSSERSEEIGILAAEDVLDFFFQTLGEEIYKKAVADCKKMLKEKMGEFEFELELLSPKT